jgi:hypothetical protein
MAVSSAGLRHKSDCSGKAQKQLYSNLQTRPLVREGATKLQTRSCLKEISRRTEIWSQVPDGHLTPGQTDRLTFGRKLTELQASQLLSSAWGYNSATFSCKDINTRDLAIQVRGVSNLK